MTRPRSIMSALIGVGDPLVSCMFSSTQGKPLLPTLRSGCPDRHGVDDQRRLRRGVVRSPGRLPLPGGHDADLHRMGGVTHLRGRNRVHAFWSQPDIHLAG